MDIKEYSKLIKAKRKELDDLMKRKMPVIAGRMAKDHFQDNFRRCRKHQTPVEIHLRFRNHRLARHSQLRSPYVRGNAGNGD